MVCMGAGNVLTAGWCIILLVGVVVERVGHDESLDCLDGDL